VLGLARNPALQRAATDWTDRAERQFGRTGEAQRLFGSFAYAAGRWDRPRRVIVKPGCCMPRLSLCHEWRLMGPGPVGPPRGRAGRTGPLTPTPGA
jgi:hypothetical protein